MIYAITILIFSFFIASITGMFVCEKVHDKKHETFFMNLTWLLFWLLLAFLFAIALD